MLNFKVYLIEKDPCWDGYQQIGMKKKGGKKVPNCVPEKAKVLDYGSDEAVKAAKKKTPGQMEDDFLPHKMYDKYGNEYAATTKAKRQGKAAGKQFVAQPKKIAAKVKPYRKKT